MSKPRLGELMWLGQGVAGPGSKPGDAVSTASALYSLSDPRPEMTDFTVLRGVASSVGSPTVLLKPSPSTPRDVAGPTSSRSLTGRPSSQAIWRKASCCPAPCPQAIAS